MRLTDLELYRWKFHNDIYIHTTKKWYPSNYPGISWSQYWKEFGAFVSVLPRQCGKSNMILTIINSLIKEGGDYRIVYASRYTKSRFARHVKKLINGNSHTSIDLNGLSYNDINLFVDEYEYIDRKNHLDDILDYPWKSVTMVSSLR